MKTTASAAASSQRIAATDTIGAVRGAPESAGDYSDRLPGTRVRLRVQAVMPDGSFRVQIDGKPAFMRLPANTQPGAVLELELVGTTPHPTYVLRGTVETASTVLSPAARLLADIPANASRPQRVPVKGAGPIHRGSPLETSALGAALHRALAHSGVFYESHLAQWIAGHRIKEELLLEPQARLTVDADERTSEGARPAPTPVTTPALSGDANVIHPDALPLVQQQLLALDTGHVMWRGVVWNEQTLEWEVAHDRGARDADETRPRWQTRLRLTLPELGQIDATIALAPAGVELRVRAGSTRAAAQLHADKDSIARAMKDAGLAVSGVEVAHASE